MFEDKPHNFDLFDLPPGDPFAETQEPMVQQQTLSATETPKPNQPDEEPQQVKDLKSHLFDGSYSEKRNKMLQRPGPTIYWAIKEEELTPGERWHREHPMSPAYGAPNIDNTRRKVEPKAPSHGQSAPWYVEGD